MEKEAEVKFLSCDIIALKDCHFYSDKREAIIKDIIWIIAAVGGIIVPFCFDKNATMGAAYFLFSLSLLMEFIPKIPFSNSLIGRLFHGVFCLFAIVMLIISIIMILAQTNLFSTFLFVLCIITILFLLIDIGISLFAPNEVFDNSSNIQKNQQTEKQLAIFLENLEKGNLGNLGGDD